MNSSKKFPKELSASSMRIAVSYCIASAQGCHMDKLGEMCEVSVLGQCQSSKLRRFWSAEPSNVLSGC